MMVMIFKCMRGGTGYTATCSIKLGSTITPWRRRQWHPTPVLLPGKSHGRRSLVGCSPWGHKELDTTERLHFHFSLSCIREANGNPLQYSCLEEPGGLLSMGSHSIGHDWSNLAAAVATPCQAYKHKILNVTIHSEESEYIHFLKNHSQRIQLFFE